jgi:hypothetical protein
MYLLDKEGYYYAPYATLKTVMLAGTQKEPTFNEVVEAARKTAKEPQFVRFYDFAMSMMSKADPRQASNTNLQLMLFHLQRFFQYGAITYKIRKEKVEFLQNVELDIPANLLILPFDEFMISIPKGTIQTSQGHLLNIYCEQEAFDEKIYLDGRYEVEENIKQLIAANPGKIKRLLRCYAISWKDGADDGMTSYYQFPVIEDENVWNQFLHLVDTTKEYKHKDTIKEVFNLMLNFCAYLSCPNPEVEKVLGIIRKPANPNSKKARAAERDNLVNGYTYFDVGRIYANRYNSNDEWMFDPDGVNQPAGKRHIIRFKVRRHIRAQWYGSKANGKPGTEQKLILIEEHWKGDDVKEAFKPKMVEVS